MKNMTKGFTLIELLAVIVILAVIALIATPIIMNVINDAKKGAAKDSMYAYVKAVELATTKDIKPDTDLLGGTYTTTDGNLYSGSTKILDVDLKGTKPDNNKGNVVIEKGLVKSADLTFDGYCIGYDGDKATNKDDCTTPPVAPNKAYTEGDIIYYNPETNKKCTSAEVNTTANAKTGCLKWNVITVGDTTGKTTVDIMLDHNTTSNVAWNSTGTNTEMKEVATALQTDVTTWNASVKSTARLITGQEVANIGKDTVWNPGEFTGTQYTEQPWLYQNLSSSNTIEKPYGYWTSTATSSSSSLAWRVTYGGSLNNRDVTNAGGYGVRPVITIFKSVIS